MIRDCLTGLKRRLQTRKTASSSAPASGTKLLISNISVGFRLFERTCRAGYNEKDSSRCRSCSTTRSPLHRFQGRAAIRGTAFMIAQALAERCHMVTVDKVFADYEVPVVW